MDIVHAPPSVSAETTSTVIGNDTSLCSLAVTVCWPSVLIGSLVELAALELDAGLLAHGVDDVGRR